MDEAQPDTGIIEIERTVDTKGLVCPQPLLMAKKEIAKISSGGIMEVLVSDENSRDDFPFWCMNGGHTFMGEKVDSGVIRFFIKKK